MGGLGRDGGGGVVLVVVVVVGKGLEAEDGDIIAVVGAGGWRDVEVWRQKGWVIVVVVGLLIFFFLVSGFLSLFGGRRSK